MDSQECNAGIETKGRARRSALAAGLLATTAIVLCSYPLQSQPAAAQTATQGAAIRTFNIPAQPLAGALNAFGRQSGLQVTLAAATTQGVNSRPINGSFTPQQALARMLEGTGIPFRITSDRTAVVGASQAAGGTGALPAGAIALDTIDVQGAGNPNSTMTLMPAYAGGQVATGGQVGMLGNRSVMNTPFSQTSYTRKLIQDQQAQTVNDVLDNDPSVITKARGVGDDTESVRGFLNYAYYGARSLNGLSGMAPLEYPSTDYIERVEILKGPSALLNGMQPNAGAPGGAVNLVTKQADDEPLTQLTTRYMSRSQFGAHVDVGRRFGDNKEFGIRFNGSLDGGSTPLDTQRSRYGIAALNLDYRGERVRLSADIAHQSRYLNHLSNFISLRPVLGTLSAVPPPPSASTSLFPSWDRNQAESTLGMVRGEVDITENVTAYAAIGAQKYDKLDSGGGAPGLLDAAGSYSVTPYVSRSSFDILSMQGGARARVETGPVAHALSLNLSQARWTLRDNYWLGSTGFVSSIYNPVFPSNPSLTDPGDPPKSNETKVSSIGIADTLSMLDERIQFTAGVRFQQVGATNFDTTTGLADSKYDSQAWSPAFALVVKPWENVSLYANYIQGLQPGTVVSNFYENAGEVFPPYVSKQYETGVKIDWGKVTTTLALFQIAQPSAIIISGSGGALPTLALNGEQVNRGIELSIYGEVVERVRLIGGMTFLDARQTKTANGAFDGERAAGAPTFRTVIGGEWDAPFVDGLTLTGRFTYTSEQVAINTRPDLTIPSWTQVDLGARYTFASPWNNKPVTVRFNVDNVFDKSYWRAPFTPGFLSMGQPRTYRLSTTFNF